MQTVLETAVAAAKAGIAVIPVKEDGSKQPDIKWAQFEKRLPTREELASWFANGRERQGLGFICGKVSGGLEMFEFDEPGLVVAFKQAAIEAGLIELVKRIEVGYSEETPGGGIHWIYRVETPLKNTKLASKPCPGAPECAKSTHIKGKAHVMIESRGEGGFVVVAPSHGGVHETGNPYVLYGLGVEHIVTITIEERDLLFLLAQTFDLLPREQAGPRPMLSSGTPNDAERPGVDFARKTDWRGIIEPHGWKWSKRYGQLDYWLRPGKEHGQHSATTGPRGPEQVDYLYVFSTSTDFDAERGYNKFAVYTILNHGSSDGDFATAARILRSQGFGGYDPNELLSKELRQKQATPAAEPQLETPADTYNFEHVFPPGHFVHDWIIHCAEQVDAAYDYHEAAAMVVLSVVTAGIKPRLSVWKKGLRTNLYVLLLGDSTVSRKSTAIGLAESLIEAVYFDQGTDVLLPDQGSQEGIIERIARRNGMGSIWMAPEFGQMLETMEKKQTLAGLKKVLLDVYDGKGYSHSRTSKRVRGESQLQADEIKIEDPYLSIIGGTTDDVLQALTTRDIKSGLLPRFAYVWPQEKPAYKDVVEYEEQWDGDFAAIVDRVKHIQNLVGHGLTVRFSPEAFKILNTVHRRIDREAKERVILARLGAMAWKVAMLSAIGELHDETPVALRVVVTSQAAERAVRLLERWRSAALLFGMGVGGETTDERHFAQKCDRVVTWLTEHDGKASRRLVARTLNLRKRDADDIEATLADQGRMVTDTTDTLARMWVLT